MHAALVSAFAVLFERVEGSKLETRPGYVSLRCPSIPFPQFNGVWADEDGATMVADLNREIEAAERLGRPFWLQTREGCHPLIEKEATRLGLTKAERAPGMIAAGDEVAKPAVHDIAIERARGSSQLADAQAVAESGFDVPAGTMAVFYTGAVATAPGFSFYLGHAAGEPVTTAISVRAGDTVGIFNVATPPAHRRRGYGTAITARAACDGIDDGASFAWLQSSEQGASVYRRIGFRQIVIYNLFTR